ncbi:MAG TPA: hypothetical protein VKL61_00015, partial [Candidatus Polarisedimenticolia bacterium]|nr:hypothetical protein [Candidatus Polarisedimenticolia bacterium]
DLPYLARPLTEAERARALAVAEAYGVEALEETAPISVVGTGPDLNSATDNGLQRAAELLGMSFRSFRYFAKKYNLMESRDPKGSFGR